MDKEEAQQKALNLLADSLGLDEFQRIAVADIVRELEQYGSKWPPEPYSEHERLLMELGELVGQRFFPPLSERHPL